MTKSDHAARTRATNADAATVASFGHEWSSFDQSEMSAEERRRLFDRYFHVFPWARFPVEAEGFDMGSGSGRSAELVAPRVDILPCIDLSEDALDVARLRPCGS